MYTIIQYYNEKLFLKDKSIKQSLTYLIVEEKTWMK